MKSTIPFSLRRWLGEPPAMSESDILAAKPAQWKHPVKPQITYSEKAARQRHALVSLLIRHKQGQTKLDPIAYSIVVEGLR